MRIDVLNPRVLPYAVTLGFLGAGALVGLVVATGNLIMIALVIGGVTGLLLLNALPVAVWLILIGVLLVSGPLAYFLPSLAKLNWLFSLLGIFMAGAALLYGVAGKEAPNRPMPTFVILALVMAILAAVGAAFSNGSMAEISAGAKRQYQFWGVLFLFAVVPFSAVSVKRWMLFLLGVAIAQLPFSLYQRLVLVPQVMGFEQPGFVPFDIVVGSFEGSMFGGGASAIMALFQVLATIALFCAWREKLISGARCLLLAVPVVAPLALGETKVVLFLIPVVLLASFYDTIAKRPLAFLGGAILTLLMAAVLAYVYFAVQVSGEVSVADNLADTFAYNFGDRGYYETGVNRLTAVPYWFQAQSWAEPMRVLFGYGIGSAYGMDGRVLLPGHTFVAHPGIHIDLLAASQLLWESGLVGTLLFYGVLLGATRSAMKSLGEAQSAWDRVICRVLLGALGSTLLMSVYSSSMVVLVTHSFLIAFTLGLVAWRARHGPLALDSADFARARAMPGGGSGGRMQGRKFKHWSSTDVPGFASAFDGGLMAGSAAAGTATGGFAPTSQTAARPSQAFRPGDWPVRGEASGQSTSPQSPQSPSDRQPDRQPDRQRGYQPDRSADFAGAGRASGDGSGAAAKPASRNAEAMFATDDEPVDVLRSGLDARQSRRDALRRQGRIDPVIDVSDDDPSR